MSCLPTNPPVVMMGSHEQVCLAGMSLLPGTLCFVTYLPVSYTVSPVPHHHKDGGCKWALSLTYTVGRRPYPTTDLICGRCSMQQAQLYILQQYWYSRSTPLLRTAVTRVRRKHRPESGRCFLSTPPMLSLSSICGDAYERGPKDFPAACRDPSVPIAYITYPHTM